MNELEDVPFFGLADVIDTVESAIMPDETVLPLLFKDYGDDLDTLLALVTEIHRSQGEMIKARTRQQMGDFEEYVRFARAQAVREERSRIEQDVYSHFYLALKSLQDKTSDVYESAREAGQDVLCSEVTQLKMMQADILSEVLRVSPDASDTGTGLSASQGFAQKCRSMGLTARQVEVAGLAARGLSNADIADRLGLSVSTVKNYLAAAMAKLTLKSRSQLASFAAEMGLFDEDRLV